MDIKEHLQESYKKLVVLVKNQNYRLVDLSNLAIQISNGGRGNIPEYIDDILDDLSLVEELGFECTSEEIEQLIEQLKIHIDQL